MLRQALVVDDSRSARFALRKMLEQQGYEVALAGSAEEAFEALGASRPDLVFLDHVMPGTDGFAALSAMKSRADTVTIPVVICSSNEGENFVRQARARGAVSVLHKPPSTDHLRGVLDRIEAISNALGGGRRPPPAAPALPQAAKAVIEAPMLEMMPESASEPVIAPMAEPRRQNEEAELLAEQQGCIEALRSELRQARLAHDETRRDLETAHARTRDELREAGSRIEALEAECASLRARLAVRTRLEADELRAQLADALESGMRQVLDAQLRPAGENGND